MLINLKVAPFHMKHKVNFIDQQPQEKRIRQLHIPAPLKRYQAQFYQISFKSLRNNIIEIVLLKLFHSIKEESNLHDLLFEITITVIPTCDNENMKSCNET